MSEDKDWGKLIRKAGLLVLILSAIGMIASMFAHGMTIWAWTFTVVFATIVISEIYSVATNGKTISTRYKHWIQRAPLPAYFTLFLMALAFVGLIVHLGVAF